ncbi:GerAB/ArcD/ProY family transporter [Clostridium tetanomorphum]|uniref:GerAB/ArcD/ProY family transporter n=1 Tax=Clostridium tetanomorphum TaxID=1553 RepID=UPI000D811A22|nr:GerAB/ArcD/ProY family transporter [Clostridium tetanomorphum]SQC03060.1 spore germination protein [Clostridium tetanomorphum]
MKEYLTNKQISFFIFGAVVGYGIVRLPKEAAECASTAGWISILFITIINMLLTYIITFLNSTFENYTFDEYSEKLVGKFITNIFIILYIIYSFLYSSIAVRNTAEIIKSSILLKTPIWCTCLLLILICYYAASKGLRVLGRICELYGIFIIFAAFIMSIIVFSEGSLLNIQPILGFDNIFTYIKSSSKLIISFLGVEFLMIVPFKKEKNKNIFKYTLPMILIIGIFYIIIFEISLSIIGAEDLVHYEDALIATAKRLDVKYLEFFRKLDGIVIIIWLMAVFTTIFILHMLLYFL